MNSTEIRSPVHIYMQLNGVRMINADMAVLGSATQN